MKFMKFMLKLMIVLVILAGIFVVSESYMLKFQYKEVKASHILLNTKDEALVIKERLKNGEPFEELAKELSLCPTKIVGGSLGWVSKDGRMDKTFTDAAFKMKKGEISEPVQTPYGWHIIRLDDVRKN
ncbi:peptidyl-prolyl cis-trans isomerase [bacterium]|nr:peptidyl-prolyl cis-trans isomerase [bacterium]